MDPPPSYRIDSMGDRDKIRREACHPITGPGLRPWLYQGCACFRLLAFVLPRSCNSVCQRGTYLNVATNNLLRNRVSPCGKGRGKLGESL